MHFEKQNDKTRYLFPFDYNNKSPKFIYPRSFTRLELETRTSDLLYRRSNNSRYILIIIIINSNTNSQFRNVNNRPDSVKSYSFSNHSFTAARLESANFQTIITKFSCSFKKTQLFEGQKSALTPSSSFSQSKETTKTILRFSRERSNIFV